MYFYGRDGPEEKNWVKGQQEKKRKKLLNLLSVCYKEDNE